MDTKMTTTHKAVDALALALDAFAALLPLIIEQKAGVARLCEIAKKYRGEL